MTVKTQIEPADEERIAKLRELVADDFVGNEKYDTNFNILRWIQGYPDATIEEISKKLRAHLKMRKSCWNLNTMARKQRQHPIHRHWKYGITEKSKVLDNVIVNIEQVSSFLLNISTYRLSVELLTITAYLEDLLAEVMELEEKTGRQASVLYVMDLSGLVYDKHLYKLVTGAMRSLSEFMATHYVELIKYFVLVNVPSFVFAIWTFTKPILPVRTRQKVRILSSNWRQEILEFACPESLPDKWNENGTQLFTNHVEPPIPYPIDQYYKNRQAKVPETENLRLAAGKTIIITRELKTGDRLSWWILGDSDFGFGLFYSSNRNEEDIENWASHNKYDLNNRRPLNNAEESTEGLAVLPTLLMENPRARGIFDNLSFYANPQYKRDYRPSKTVDVHISEADN
ncbi:Cellular retinaldehyde-binding triple function domain containing protein [Aphelenchoides besseyi]|nr:Cellular retinaldehyde-binding triple function domain containing protein [Aphelenchoides besseyi]